MTVVLQNAPTSHVSTPVYTHTVLTSNRVLENFFGDRRLVTNETKQLQVDGLK